MLKHRSSEYSVMSPLTALVIVLSVMGMAVGEKTEKQWLTSIDKLFKLLNKAYKVGDQSALKELTTEDVHRFPPGETGTVGLDEALDNYDPAAFDTFEPDDLLAFCGNGAVIEFKTTHDNQPKGGIRYGKGMALVIEDGDTIKIKSYIFNFDD